MNKNKKQNDAFLSIDDDVSDYLTSMSSKRSKQKFSLKDSFSSEDGKMNSKIKPQNEDHFESMKSVVTQSDEVFDFDFSTPDISTQKTKKKPTLKSYLFDSPTDLELEESRLKVKGNKVKSSPTTILVDDDLDLLGGNLCQKEGIVEEKTKKSEEKKRKSPSSSKSVLGMDDFEETPHLKKRKTREIFDSRDSISEAEKSGLKNATKHESPVKNWLEKKPNLSLFEESDKIPKVKTSSSGSSLEKQTTPSKGQTKSPTPQKPLTPLSNQSTHSSMVTLNDINSDSQPNLTEQQIKVVGHVLEGRSIFFTGCAGTGKSTLLRYLINLLPRSTTFVTASTGIAAINIGGITVHSFAGIGKGEGSKIDCLNMVQASSRHKNWWNSAKILIIDEISMVDADLFEKLDFIAKVVRREPNKPFGGLQLICSGDFFQLPPVSVNGEEKKFCFESPIWTQAIQVCVELTKVFRQSDQDYIDLLNEIRHGECSPATLQKLESRVDIQMDTEHGIIPTRLYPHIKDVDEFNETQLQELSTKGKKYKAKDVGANEFLEILKKHSPVPHELKLKKGAQVLLVKNIFIRPNHSQSIANGSRGIVLDFDETRRGFPIVKFHNGITATIEPKKWTLEVAGKEVASREQVPLKLAWAISIHKVQGSTISVAQISLKNVFECGQAYVALSRVSSLEGLYLLDFNPKRIRVHPKVLEFYKNNMAFVESVSSSPVHSSSFKSQNTKPDLGYIVNYAASSRSACRHCKQKIEKKLLRLGKYISSSRIPEAHSIIPLWFHLDCFFESNQRDKVHSVEQFEGFYQLLPSDQQKIATLIGDTNFGKVSRSQLANPISIEKTSKGEVVRIDFGKQQQDEQVDVFLNDWLPSKLDKGKEEEDEDLLDKKHQKQVQIVIGEDEDLNHDDPSIVSDLSDVFPSPKPSVKGISPTLSSQSPNVNTTDRQIEMEAWKKFEELESKFENTEFHHNRSKTKSSSQPNLSKPQKDFLSPSSNPLPTTFSKWKQNNLKNLLINFYQ